eukprot:Skav202911  [mRNA]  locus=scaffold1565:68595:74060:+ [translate_table: standard]
MSSYRRSTFVDFLLLNDVNDDLLTLSFPKGWQQGSKVNRFTSFTQSQAFSGLDSFLESKDLKDLGHVEAPSMLSALLFGTGLAAIGAGAYLFTRQAPAPAAAPAAAPGAPAAPAEPAAAPPPSAETSDRLARRAQLVGELQTLEPTSARRQELQQEILQLEQEIEATNPEILAGRTLRQLLAADSAQRANASTESFLQLLYNRVAPPFTRMEQMKRLLENRVQNVSTRVPQIINEEVEAATEETRNLLGIPLPDARFNISEQLPSLTMLLAGLMAPLQLKAMYADNILRLGVSGAILSMDLIALLTSHGTRCISQQLPFFGTLDALHWWIAVDALSLGFSCAVSAMVLQKCGATIAEVDASRELPETNPSSDPEDMDSSLAEAFRAALEKQLLAGSKAIIMLLPVLSLFDFAWQANGLMLMFDTPGSSCGAHFLLDWSRVRLAVSSSGFGQTLLEAAANLDEERTAAIHCFTEIHCDAVEAKLAQKEAELQTTSENIRMQEEAAGFWALLEDENPME